MKIGAGNVLNSKKEKKTTAMISVGRLKEAPRLR
jgi:hypothetical protein